MTIVPPTTPPLNPPMAPPPHAATPAPHPVAHADLRRAPFLVWPVSRREFYRAIWLAMLPVLIWGAIVYGIFSIAMLVAAFLFSTLIHLLLKKWLPWPRGKQLLYPHTLTCAFLLVALAHPLWPVWTIAAAAVLLPVILGLLGGPGKEPVHVAVILVFAIQFALLPALRHTGTYAGGPAGLEDKRGGDALLARDRLFMGDLRAHRDALFYDWPRSRDLEGADAFNVEPPARPAVALLDDLSAILANPQTEALAPITLTDQRLFETRLAHDLAYRMPDLSFVLLGAVPGRIGTVCLIGIVLAGLYLSYRTILRPRSVVMFLAAVCVGIFLTILSPAAISHAGPIGLGHLARTWPAEIATLLNYILLNSDAPFAAVFILALPGTEPLTPRGRRIFLIAAGLIGALLHRLAPTIPAFTLALCALMPFTRAFDYWFSRRSWLNARP